MAERYPPVYLATEPAPNGRLMTERRKSASNCPGKCRHPASVHPGFIGEMACLDTKTGVSRQKLASCVRCLRPRPDSRYLPEYRVENDGSRNCQAFAAAPSDRSKASCDRIWGGGIAGTGLGFETLPRGTQGRRCARRTRQDQQCRPHYHSGTTAAAGWNAAQAGSDARERNILNEDTTDGRQPTSRRHHNAGGSVIMTRIGVGLKPLQGLLICGQLEMTKITSMSAVMST